MNNNFQNKERFDAWLNHEMNADERALFEAEIEANAEFRNEFFEHQAFVRSVADAAEYAAIRNTLRNIHNKPGVVHKSFFLTRQFYIPLALVAGLALLFIVINPFIQEGNNMADNSDYQHLKYEETSASAESSDAMTMDSSVSPSYEISDDGYKLNLSPDTLKPLVSAPTGTAFMISNQGYFLTSRHLVEDHSKLILQSKEFGRAFETAVVYEDTLMDFAILQCHPDVARYFEPVPFKFLKGDVELGQDVFTLGYPKKDIVYTKGEVSSETGYKSDTLSFQVSLPSNPGYSGAPLFTYEGDLVGIINANNNKQQAVTYVINHHYILGIVEELSEIGDLQIDLDRNYTKRYKEHSKLVKVYRAFVFEVHP